MPQISLNIQYSKNNGQVISAQEMKQMYLFGLPLTDRNGQDLPEQVYNDYIMSAQEEIENTLNIKLQKQVIEENLSYFRDEFQQMGYVSVTYLINEMVSLDGFLGTIRQIQYPKEWLSARKTSDGESFYRNFYIVPNQGAATTGSLVYNGIIPYIGISSYDQIPNYWTTKYVTGFDRVPRDLMNIIGKLAAINVLELIGDLALGRPGLSNISLGIDGLSQSLGSKGYEGRIKMYLEDIKNSMDRIRNTYKGFTFTSM
jgi:hypothetical protein